MSEATDSVFPDVQKMTVEKWLDTVDYSETDGYIPSQFALDFVNVMKLMNGAEGNENKTPVVHYKMLDNILQENGLDTINMCHRGIAKSTLLGEYLFLYIAVFGELPGFGKIPFALYVSDSIDNGVKKMRKNLEFRWDNSKFLQEYIPQIKFTDIRWEFVRKDGTSFVVSGYGAKTGVRGTREQGSRPVLAVLDDLISDEDARSPTVLSAVEDTVYKAIDYALHPKKRKIIWSGTPFNASDPLYKAVESGAWNVNVYPVCETFPCKREEFRGSWEDRFDYDYVTKQYSKAKLSGKIDTFNQELMLRIMSDEDRVIQDSDLRWFNRKSLGTSMDAFNIYITTDFATSDKTSADFSVISVWAYNHNGDWLWLDGVCRKQLMDQNIDDLFRLVQKYRPISVGIEVSGQQAGFIPWIQKEMAERNCWFNMASDNNSGRAGIRPSTNKMERFNVVVPWFKANKVYFPEDAKHEDPIIEALDELSLVSRSAFKSKHDDFIDTISMLALMNAYKPADISTSMVKNDDSGIWEPDMFEDESSTHMNSYLV